MICSCGFSDALYAWYATRGVSVERRACTAIRLSDMDSLPTEEGMSQLRAKETANAEEAERHETDANAAIDAGQCFSAAKSKAMSWRCQNLAKSASDDLRKSERAIEEIGHFIKD